MEEMRKKLTHLYSTFQAFSNDINMDFGNEKCAMIVMKRGKLDMKVRGHKVA